MHIFKDGDGKDWTVQIHVTAVKRCRALVGVDLYSLVDGGFQGLGGLLSDPVNLVDTIFVLCKADADARGVSDERFGELMAGDVIERATTAFIEELVDFFPDPRVRAGIRSVVDKSRTVQARLMEHMGRAIDGIDPDSVARRLIDSSGSSPGSSASTPDPSPSAS